MSSRYKACHIKIFIWWLSRKSQHAADRSNGDEPRQVSIEEFHGMAPHSRHGEIYIPACHVSSSEDRLLQVLAMCAFNLQRSIEIMDNSGMILSNSDASECSQGLMMFLKGYSWLATYYRQRSILLFRMRPKHHMMWHQGWQIHAWKLNQNIWHTFDEESFLGKLKQICKCCHGGTATRRVYQRYILVLAMMVEEHRRFASKLP